VRGPGDVGETLVDAAVERRPKLSSPSPAIGDRRHNQQERRLGAVVWLFVAFIMDMERGEEHQRRFREEQRSGKWDFGDQPALFALAQAIVKNDENAIRAAAKAIPDLQVPGGDGATLLCFAVTQSWQRPELAEAVRTLLSLGADPNYTNGKRNSFAMANAVHASAPVLRAMLEAGGNPNARDEFGEPMILMNWYLGYYPNQARSRLELLLDHAADVNSAMPAIASNSAGYTLLLYRTKMGLDDNLAYADALTLLKRGADPNRAGADGMTFGKMLVDHQAHFGRTLKRPPVEFVTLWDWAETHGIR
jgi:ankyrin repeat protein